MNNPYFAPHGHTTPYNDYDWTTTTKEFQTKQNELYQEQFKATNLDLYQYFLYTTAYNRADLQEKVQLTELTHPPLVINNNQHTQHRPLMPFQNIN